MIINLANAKSLSQAFASWSTEWWVTYPTFRLWRGQTSMRVPHVSMFSMFCSFPQAHSEVVQLPHLWMLAQQRPCLALKGLNVNHYLLGRLVPGICWLGLWSKWLYWAGCLQGVCGMTWTKHGHSIQLRSKRAGVCSVKTAAHHFEPASLQSRLFLDLYLAAVPFRCSLMYMVQLRVTPSRLD